MHDRTFGIPRNVDDSQSVDFAGIIGSIAEDRHLTHCAHVCFAGTEEDQTEPHDEGRLTTSWEITDTDEVTDTTVAVDEEAELLEQMPPHGHPE